MAEKKKGLVTISTQALRRMPYYLEYLKKQRDAGAKQVAAPAIAVDLGLNEVQVRKDLAAVSETRGKPRTGFPIEELIRGMEKFLDFHNIVDAVLVGAGSLGRALLSYSGFDRYGMRIVAAFDVDEAAIGQEIHGKTVFSMDRLHEICRRMNVHIGIIVVPADQAQRVCETLIEAGILAIWNFAPTHLSTPKSILVQNENMAASLALLSKHLREKMDAE